MDKPTDSNVVPNDDSKNVVQDGYNNIAATYLNWIRDRPTARITYLDKLLALIPDASKVKVLELGCGAGIPITQILSQKCAHVVANDISEAQIGLAKANVPNTNVEFVVGDMTKLPFEPSSLDAVVAYYSIIHLPRDQQRTMLSQIWSWLPVGGHVVSNFGVVNDEGGARDWLGTKMFWSSFDAETYLQLFKDTGFSIVESEIIEDNEDGRMVPFLWILASKK